MLRSFGRTLLCLLLLGFGFFLHKVLWPRTYDVPLTKKRAGIQYWHLPTGSTIGYTYIPAKGIKKPYPVIFLHGGPGGYVNDRDVQMLTPLSESGYDVYLYDQVGSGQSERLENINEYSPERHKKDLEEISKIIGAEKMILVGQSWGAILSVLFVADNADKVQELIFISPGPLFPRRVELERIKAPDSLHLKEPYFSNQQGNDRANNLRTGTMRMMAEKWGNKFTADGEADAFATYLSHEVNKSAVCDTSKILKAEAGSGYYAQIMTFKNLLEIKDPRPKLKDCKIPLLMVKGQCDNQKWGYATEYLTLFPNHQLSFIPNAGHFISVEQPGLLAKTIQEFIDRK